MAIVVILCSNNCFITNLSIELEANTPFPTYGMSITSNNP